MPVRSDRLRVLTLTTLFPNAAQPHHGVFVENRLRHLAGSGRVDLKIVAPVPWVPPFLTHHPRYRDQAQAPRSETRHDLPVVHPRYAVVPRLGMLATPATLASAFQRGVKWLGLTPDDIDLIDAHYFYPDGVAAMMLGRLWSKPVIITGRGTDLNLIPRHALPRRMIRWAADHAAGMITVCAALKEALTDLGVPAERVSVLRNGVDLELYRPPADRAAARAALRLDGPTLASVGHLIERKGHHLVIEALTTLPDVRLLIAGDGEERRNLEALVARLGLGGRVRFLGRLAPRDLPAIYGAVDALVLASSREGWANVLLESMACGTPVVATRVWGTPEVVADPAAGLLSEARSAPAIADAVRRLLGNPPDRAATRRYAEKFSWDETTRGQLALFEAAIRGADTQALAAA